MNIQPAMRLKSLEIMERGELKERHAQAIVNQLPEYIAKRELQMVQKMLNWDMSTLETVVSKESHGPGNVLILEMAFESMTEIFTGFGERGVSAEDVAKKACQEARDYLASGAPVGKHLADQLLLPLTMAGKGRFLTMSPSRHTTTNIEVIRKFMDIPINCTPHDERVWQVTVG